MARRRARSRPDRAAQPKLKPQRKGPPMSFQPPACPPVRWRPDNAAPAAVRLGENRRLLPHRAAVTNVPNARIPYSSDTPSSRATASHATIASHATWGAKKKEHGQPTHPRNKPFHSHKKTRPTKQSRSVFRTPVPFTTLDIRRARPRQALKNARKYRGYPACSYARRVLTPPSRAPLLHVRPLLLTPPPHSP